MPVGPPARRHGLHMSERIALLDAEGGLDLVADGVTVGQYRLGAEISPVDTPKPHFHPLRTLAGAQVTDFAPEDHPWHHGLFFAFPRVGDDNLWGGGTYLNPTDWYRVLDDQGRIDHLEWLDRSSDDSGEASFTEALIWRGHDGADLLGETRAVRAHRTQNGWALDIRSRLTNLTDRPLTLATPAQRGRPDGGYGGLFLRLAEGFTPSVMLADDDVEVTASGAVSETLVVSGTTGAGDEMTLGLAFLGPEVGDSTWLYRFEDFPAIGWASAYENAFELAPEGDLELNHRLAIYDGIVAPAEVRSDLTP